VIATHSTPREDWVKTRVFAWMTAFLHFDKILQIPLMVTHELTGAPYREIVERFTDKKALANYPVFQKTLSFFEDEARKIQAGGEEYVYSKEWLGIWWPADEYALIDIVSSGSLPAFYEEAEKVLLTSFSEVGPAEFPEILREAVKLNQALLKVPFANQNLELNLSWNLLEFRRRVMSGENTKLEVGEFLFSVDRKSESWNSLRDWCERVVWWGNKRGAYLYGNAPVRELAGHY